MTESTTERLRATLRTTESQLKEILQGLESRDLDGGALSDHLLALERTLRNCRRAA